MGAHVHGQSHEGDMRIRESRWGGYAVLLVAASLTACGASGPADVQTPKGNMGRYVLESIDGRSMPTYLYRDQYTEIILHDDELILNPDGSASATIHFRLTLQTSFTESTTTGSGTYKIDGTSIRTDMESSTDGSNPSFRTSYGTIGNGILTFVESDGTVFRYVRK